MQSNFGPNFVKLSETGIIALQIHGNAKSRIRYKEIVIGELPREARRRANSAPRQIHDSSLSFPSKEVFHPITERNGGLFEVTSARF